MKIKLILVFVTLLVIFPSSTFASVQTLGKKDAAPGQVKKSVDVNIGTVGNIGTNKVEIKSKDKKVEIITDKNTQIIEKPSGKKIDLEKIKKDDHIATFELKSKESTKSAKLILVKPGQEATGSAKPETKRRAVYGLVREIAGNVLVISHPIKNNPRYNVTVLDSTAIKIKNINGATIDNIKVGDRVAAVGNWSGENLLAKRVHVIPGRAIGLLEKVGTPSALPATPSASPATPSASPI